MRKYILAVLLSLFSGACFSDGLTGPASGVIVGDRYQFSGALGDCTALPTGDGFTINTAHQIIFCASGVQVSVVTASTFAAFVQNTNAYRGFQMINSNAGAAAQTCAVWRNNTSTAANDYSQFCLNGPGVSTMNGANALTLANIGNLFLAAGGCVYTAACAGGTSAATNGLEIDTSGNLYFPHLSGGSTGCLLLDQAAGLVSVGACSGGTGPGPNPSGNGDIATLSATGGILDSAILATSLAPKASPTFTGTVALPIVTTSGAVTLGGALGLGGFNISNINNVTSKSTRGYQLNVGTPSGTAPSLSPDKADTTTGIGAQASGNMSLIVGGTEIARVASTGIILESSAQMVFAKATDPGTAAGAGFCKEYWVAGTNAGTGKKVAYCGTSTTPTTIVDNVGAGF